jgi:SAM-dependent methyltransferase
MSISAMPVSYRHGLAYIHDAGFGHVAQAAACVLLQELARARIEAGLVIDLGCGSGILSERVGKSGFDVLGIDLSPAMIRLARQRVPTGTFRLGSLWNAQLPPCVAVAAVGECVNYLFDSQSSTQSLTRFFRRVHDSLLPGGVFLFDASGPGRVPGGGPTQSHFDGNGWAVLVTAEEDDRRGMLMRRITSFRQTGRTWRRDEELHRLRLYKPEDVLGLLGTTGFRARTMRQYGDFQLPTGWSAFLARKPKRRS